ncbi:nicotinate-nucleotide adenylyltransferase [Planctomycetota bacterium]
MDGLTCDRCGRPLLVGEEARYVCEIKVYAAYDPLEITREDLERATDPESWRRVLAACEQRTDAELQDEIYRNLRFDLCMGCHGIYLRAPLPPHEGEVVPRSLTRRVGVVGGSFDPIHAGHLHLAGEVCQRLALDRVLLVPTAAQPLKDERHAASPRDRLHMAEAAAHGLGAWLSVSDTDVLRGGLSYTVDTLTALREELGRYAELFFVAGADVVDTLHCWERLDEVLTMATFCIASRPGYRVTLPKETAERVSFVEIEPLEVSSTEIRERLAHGEPTDGLLHPLVREIIVERGLYQAKANDEGRVEGD